MSESKDINNYIEQLQQLCAVCRKKDKCKDKSKICYAKWVAFKIARIKYARETKKVR